MTELEVRITLNITIEVEHNSDLDPSDYDIAGPLQREAVAACAALDFDGDGLDCFVQDVFCDEQHTTVSLLGPDEDEVYAGGEDGLQRIGDGF